MAKCAPSAGTAVIVGNGSSVDSAPESFWRRCIAGGTMLIGTNRVLCSRTLAHLPWHALVIRDTYRNLWHDQRWGAKYHQELWKPCPAWKVGPACSRVTHCDQFLRFEDGWQAEAVFDSNGEAAVMKNPSVVLMAANWAWLQGARRIVLAGVDYGGGHLDMIDPYNVSTGLEGRYAPPPGACIERAFAHAASVVGALGGTLVSVSHGTRLEAIEVVAWDDALES
ncbi:MAG: hypothetical protein ABFD92_09220 [Planctomycetaceae bacterium]|nr:hypothetical protein [Planctomycetaceae bacterium]